jgi:hypothetical protein
MPCRAVGSSFILLITSPSELTFGCFLPPGAISHDNACGGKSEGDVHEAGMRHGHVFTMASREPE